MRWYSTNRMENDMIPTKYCSHFIKAWQPFHLGIQQPNHKFFHKDETSNKMKPWIWWLLTCSFHHQMMVEFQLLQIREHYGKLSGKQTKVNKAQHIPCASSSLFFPRHFWVLLFTNWQIWKHSRDKARPESDRLEKKKRQFPSPNLNTAMGLVDALEHIF